MVESSWGFASPKFVTASDATGHRLGELRRRGKYLLVDLHRAGGCRDREHGDDGEHEDDGEHGADRELVVHLGMTGRLAVLHGTDQPPGNLTGRLGSELRPEHLRARFDLDDGHYLGFWDLRRFGRAVVVEPGDHSGLPTLANLGPEPFSPEFSPERLRAGLSGRKALKTSLMDQRLVAGVGNIYADEALWLSGIRPTARRLGPARAEALHRAVVEVLSGAIGNGGTTLRDYRDASGAEGSNQHRLRRYGRAGEECLRCGRPLAHTVLDGRGTTWCTNCQH